MTVAEPPTTSPRIAGKEPIFRHLDDPDMGFRNVRAQRNADGTESYVREKWLAFSPDPQYLSLYAEYDPGMVIERHGHSSDHVIFVTRGSVAVGDVDWSPGMMVLLEQGAIFGPLVAGPEGTELLEFYTGNPGPVSADPDGFQALLAERG